MRNYTRCGLLTLATLALVACATPQERAVD